MTREEEAALLHDEIDAIADGLVEEGDIERGTSIKVKIARLRQILADMAG